MQTCRPDAAQVFVLSQLGDVAAVVRACTASAALQRLLREAAWTQVRSRGMLAARGLFAICKLLACYGILGRLDASGQKGCPCRQVFVQCKRCIVLQAGYRYQY